LTDGTERRGIAERRAIARNRYGACAGCNDAKKAEPATIRAILVDPAARTVKGVRLRTEPGDARYGYGVQIAEGAAEKLIGSDTIDSLDLPGGQVVLVDQTRQSETAETWTFADDGEPIVGPGIIVSHDPDADEYADATMSLEDARKAVQWGDDEGARTELLSKIIDRLDEMDAAELKRVQTMLDQGEFDQGAGARAGGETETAAAPAQPPPHR
jgi:hypothetical protein